MNPDVAGYIPLDRNQGDHVVLLRRARAIAGEPEISLTGNTIKGPKKPSKYDAKVEVRYKKATLYEGLFADMTDEIRGVEDNKGYYAKENQKVYNEVWRRIFKS